MLIGGKSLFRGGPAGPPGSTAAAALTDVVAAVKAVLTAPNLSAARAAFGLTIGSAVQAWSATLDQLASLATTAFGRSLLTQADAPTALTTLGAVPAARQVAAAAGGGLQGGGTLAGDLQFAIAAGGVANAMLGAAPAYTLKANLLASAASPADVGLSALIDAMFGNTRGALLARGASGWGLLAPGTVGQYLGTGGPGADPSWGTPAGAGNISAANSPAAGQFALFASGTSIKGVSAPSFRNRLINGALAVNQRGSAAASTAYSAGVYIMDGWKAGANGVTLSFAAAANGDVTVTITAGTLVQIIEGIEHLKEGGTYVANWTGTATARVYQGAASGSYAAAPLAVTGITAGTNAAIEFSTGTLTLAQLEPGSTPTPFERRGDEMRRCERYYQKGTAQFVSQGYTAGAASSMTIRLGTAMAASPTATTSGVSASNMNPPVTVVQSPQDILFYATTTQATTAGSYQFTWIAKVEL